MAHTGKLLAALLLSCIALEAAAYGAHPEVLSFFRQAVPSPLESEAGLGQTSSRRLQQTFDSPAQPFTFDGFGFGYGGVFPGGGAFNNFAVNIYNILFRDIFNEGLNQYLARLLPNQLPDAANFVPTQISQYFTRDVVDLFGFDFFDRYIGQYYTFASAKLGDLVDAGCTGPVYSLSVDGGSAEIMDDGTVEATPPSIVLTAEPTVCNLPYRSAASLEGAGWQFVQQFGKERNGDIGPPPGEYNFGAALNVTAPYIGFSFQLQRLANDFGVQQWYQFVAGTVLGELIRIQTALLNTVVDDNLATAFGTTGRRLAASGSTTNGSSSFLTTLIQRIAHRLGMSSTDLSKGLQALNAYNGPVIGDVAGAAAVTSGKDKPAIDKQEKPIVSKGDAKPADKPTVVKSPTGEPAKDKPAAKPAKTEAAKPAKPEAPKASDKPAPKAPEQQAYKAELAQGKTVVQSSDQTEGNDSELLGQLGVGIQQMQAQAEPNIAAAQKKTTHP